MPVVVRKHADEYRMVLHGMLEGIIDRMKTKAEDIDVLLVGGIRRPFPLRGTGVLMGLAGCCTGRIWDPAQGSE